MCKIYHYDPSTSAYLWASDADEDQMSPGSYLVPAFATTIRPQAAKSGYHAFFVATKNVWEVRKVEAASAEPASTVKALTLTEQVAALRVQLTTYVNSVAQSVGFESIAEAVTYADEDAVPSYQTLGKALRAWRSQFWYDFETNYEPKYVAGSSSILGWSELVELLPKFVNPLTTTDSSIPAEAS